MIAGTCADYRASAKTDLEHDKLDRSQKIQCPVLVLWGKKGTIERKYDVLSIWRERAFHVTGKAVNCGRFLPEEAPEETDKAIVEFLQKG